MATAYQPEQIAGFLLGDPAFRNLKLGTWLNTPQADLLAAAVDALP